MIALKSRTTSHDILKADDEIELKIKRDLPWKVKFDLDSMSHQPGVWQLYALPISFPRPFKIKLVHCHTHYGGLCPVALKTDWRMRYTLSRTTATLPADDS